ncbi:hypothetical protein [Natronorubrum halophilum]|uniref:hypothetical protein n=1 Tax=Natronorubrum halophilum TaxID=1702106 RepID=UPI0010C20E32|nr:hypothetical protein [Natronorubrum halophilum]
MKRFVWVLVVLYVVLGSGLFYGLAVESPTLFVATGGVLVSLALPQWYLLSRYNRRARDPAEPLQRDRS